MTENFKDSSENIPIPFEERYEWIDKQNTESFWMTEPHFETRFSLHDTGGPRLDSSRASQAERFILAGNMSHMQQGKYGPVELTPEERMEDAKRNFEQFILEQGLALNNVRVLNPERDYSTPLTIVDIDNQPIDRESKGPVRLDTSGDFIFTRNPDIILAVRPADCPVVTGTVNTEKEGKIHFMLHLAWMGAAIGYIPQAKKWFDEQGADFSTFRMYISPGGHAENFHYRGYREKPTEKFADTEGLFVNLKSHVDEDSNETTWSFDIDLPYFVYKHLVDDFEIDPKQVFADTSDTCSDVSGYSSHGRSVRLAKKLGEDVSNTRDTFISWFSDFSSPE